MPARRVTTVTVPVDGRSGVAFEAYRDRTPLLTIWAARPGLLVTLTLPEHLNAGHVRFARDLAATTARYAVEVERSWRGLPALQPSGVRVMCLIRSGPGRCSPHRPGPFPFVPAQAPLRKEPVHHDRSAHPGHPGEISALLDQARGLTRESPLADQIAYHERKASCCPASPPPGHPRGAPGRRRRLALRRGCWPASATRRR